MWKILQAIVLFVTAGFVFAKDALARIGFDNNTVLIIALGLGITTMLMYRSMVSILVMILFALLIRLPDVLLDSYGLDRDILMVCAISTLCLPWLHKLASN